MSDDGGTRRAAARESGKVTQAGERRDSYVESMRALGCLAVVFAHIGVVSLGFHPAVPQLANAADVFTRFVYGAGNAALFLFFAISGFVIYMPFAKRYFAAGNPVDLRRYAVNRALRILPIYYIVVALVLIIDFDGATFGIWARFLSFSQNFNDFTVFQFVGVSWSLVVELHFYLVLPLLAWGVARIAGRSLLRAAAILGVIGLACLAMRHIYVFGAEGASPVWRASTLTNFQFIVAGMIAALAYLHLQTTRPSWLRGWLVRSDLWMLAALVLLYPFAYIDYSYDFLCLVMSFLIIGAAAFPYLERGPITRVLWWRPLAVLGLASYSIYLLHVEVLQFFFERDVTTFVPLMLTVVPASIVVSLISYKIIEEPFLRLRRRWSRSAP
ncbi:MAG: acyltransferase family protein, partial [Solirubrobacterales bacterium]